MANCWLSVDLQRYASLDDWVYERVICEDCRRIIDDPPPNAKYYDRFIACDSGPQCPDNETGI